MKSSKQSGSHIIALAFGVLVVAVIAFAGYKVWRMQQTTSPSAPATTASASVPATIKSSADLKQAANALDAASSQLNTNLNDSALNADISSML